MSNDKKQLLFGLTTTPKSNWRDKVAEIKELGLKEIALLPTCLSYEERQDLYKLLETSGVVNIPYVHLRQDFFSEELDYLMERFKTKIFSCHANPEHLVLLDSLARYASLIYVENGDLRKDLFFNKDTFTKHQAIGVCLDLAHYQNTKDTDKPGYRRLLSVLADLPIGVNHISGYKHDIFNALIGKREDSHWISSLKDLEYLKTVPLNYFSKYIVLEVENSLLEQQEIMKYLKLILANIL